MNKYAKYMLCSMSVLGMTMLASCMGIEEEILKELKPSDSESTDDEEDEAKAGEDMVLSYELNDTFSYLFDENSDGYKISSLANKSLKTITIPERVIEIGEKAFDDSKNLKTICISNTVKSIGRHAFDNCNGLENIYYNGTIEDWLNIKFFDYASNPMRYANNFYILDSNGDISFNDNKYTLLTKLVIPECVSEIKEYQFYRCKSITSVTLHQGITKIGKGAFSGCYRLFEIYNMSSLDIHEGYENNGEIAQHARVIHTDINEESVITILDNGLVFAYTNSLGYLLGYIGIKTSINLPETFTYNDMIVEEYAINDYAFNGCKSLTNINLAESITRIGSASFMGCVGLKSIEIPDSVKYIGENAFEGCTSLESATLSNSITSINNGLFYGCSSLKEISIPDNVLSIGNAAFEGCMSLLNVVIPASCKSIGYAAFYDCRRLMSITLGEGVETIGFLAFDGCARLVEIYNLSSLYIVPHTTSNGCVGKYAYKIHTSLKEKSITTIDSNGFMFAYTNNRGYLIGYNGDECDLTLPEGFSFENATIDSYYINDYAFWDMDSIKSINIGDSVEQIGNAAFWSCDNLKTVEISDSCKSIGDNAFCDCINLKTITLPNIKAINSYTFYNCESLENITLPNTLETIGYSAFYGCSSLINIIIPSNVKSIRNYAFRGCSKLIEIYNLSDLTIKAHSTMNGYLGYSALAIHSSLSNDSIIVVSEDMFVFAIYDDISYLVGYFGEDRSITLPKSFIYNGNEIKEYSIYKEAFLNNKELEEVFIPSSVIRIEEKAFSGCIGLKNVYIESGTTTIGQYAFSGCISLYDIALPEGVKNIGSHAFEGCMFLQSITIPKTLLSIGGFAFNNCLNLKEIYYTGDKEMFNLLTIGGKNVAIYSAEQYYYSEIKPEIMGNYWYYKDNSRSIWE
ncbi:MAG: leucine-rich repeat domain-containing protein [Acholeplasmatales bacterium]|nr:leucine-rich repeat domain-containing protein [Acholeplasmatales bacterium]